MKNTGFSKERFLQLFFSKFMNTFSKEIPVGPH